jgi:hypothetical protein
MSFVFQFEIYFPILDLTILWLFCNTKKMKNYNSKVLLEDWMLQWAILWSLGVEQLFIIIVAC